MSKRKSSRQRVERKHRWFKNRPQRLAGKVLDALERFGRPTTPSVDGVNLDLGDGIKLQTNSRRAAENGVYHVVKDGTWKRVT